MKPRAQDFPELIRWLVDTHHEGVVDNLAHRVGISGALADRWVKGRVRMPTIQTLDKLCKAYDLDLGWVLKLVRRVAVFMLALTLLSIGGVRPAGATQGIANFTNIPSYRLLPHLRKRYQWVCKLFRTLLAVTSPTPEEVLRIVRAGRLG